MKFFKKNFCFKADKLKITLSQQLLAKPDYSKPVPFGVLKTDHMLEIDHDIKTGWSDPYISPYHNLSIDPRNSTLHYGIELFEGLKAYRNKSDLYLFRPEMNMKRMNDSAARIGLPSFNGEELIKCIEKLVKVEEGWVHDSPGFSLYIRPTFISMTDVLGVSSASKSKIFVILSPAGPYFATGMKPLRLTCNDESYVRSFKGGFGHYKLGANYGPTLQKYNEAVKAGYNHILWLTNDK